MRTDPLMNLTYQKGKDGLLYPELQISEDEKTDRTPVGKFGRLWKEYMTENHPHRLSELVAQSKINETISKVDGEAESRKERLIQELLKAQPMPDTEDPLERAGHMNMITATAEEIVLNELVLKVR
ncbi:TnpV protein [Caproicibacter fermentans]|uniref:TnpV protein n=1 Tax=Caproicibacter fermentans TaxID=2576756 RepID=A0A7G8TF04_9FIRM|nr:TnpV protein [Caproicibacter fermentans]QNK42195.1 TnpV protein [Caproicibacter fermentans]